MLRFWHVDLTKQRFVACDMELVGSSECGGGVKPGDEYGSL